jgi:hypothetical protein
VVPISDKKTTIKYKGGYTPDPLAASTNSIISFFETTYDGIKSGVVYQATTQDNIKRFYVFDTATMSELNMLVKPKQSDWGNLKANYVSTLKVVTISNRTTSEWDKWHDNTNISKKDGVVACNDYVKGIISEYYKSGLNKTVTVDCNNDWSAPFLSYVIKQSGGGNFPYSDSNAYIVEQIRNNTSTNKSWFGYKLSDTNATIGVGDIICFVKGKSLNTSFNKISATDKTDVICGVVVSIDSSNNARMLFGNFKNSVSDLSVSLDSDSKISSIDAQLIDGTAIKYCGVLKYQPVDTTSFNITSKSTSHANQLAIQLTVMKYLRDIVGLSRVAIAGAMGNMELESQFNPLIVNKQDKNGFIDVGLINWNMPSLPGGKAKNAALNNTGQSKDQIIQAKADYCFNIVGRTVTDQLNYLNNNWGGFKKYITAVANETDVLKATFLFAKFAEACYLCDTTYNTYASSYQVIRSEFALDFYNRLGDPNDPLYYGSSANVPTPTNNNSTPSSVVIGDSISLLTHGAYSNVGIISSPVILNESGQHALWLYSQLTKSPVQPAVKNLIVSIGSNDQWGTTSLTNLINVIKQKFPNASYYILNGNYGWGSLKLDTTTTPVHNSTYWTTQINNYINVFTSNGFRVVGDITYNTSHPSVGGDLLNSFKPILSTLV